MNVHAAEGSNNLSNGICPPSRPATSELLEKFAEEIAALERSAPPRELQHHRSSPSDANDGFSPRPLAEETTTKAVGTSAKLPSFQEDIFGTTPLMEQALQQAKAMSQNHQKILHPYLFGDAAATEPSAAVVPNAGADALLPDELSEFFAWNDAARRSSLAPILSALEQQGQQQQQPGGAFAAFDPASASRRSSLVAAAGMSSSSRSSLAPFLSLMDGFTGGGASANIPQDRRKSLDFLAGVSSRRSSLGPLFQGTTFLPQQTPASSQPSLVQQQEDLPFVAAAGTAAAASSLGRKRKLDEFGREYEVGTLNDLDQDEGDGDRLRHRQQRRRSSVSLKTSILRRMSGFSCGGGSIGPLDQFDWAASSVPPTTDGGMEDVAAQAQHAMLMARRRSSMGMNSVIGGMDFGDDAVAQVALARRRSSMGMEGGMLRRLSSMGTLASAGWLDEALGVPVVASPNAATPRPPGQGDAAAGLGIGIDLEEELFRRSSLGFHQNYQSGVTAAATAPSAVINGASSNNEPLFVTPDFGGVVEKEPQVNKEKSDMASAVANIVTPSLEAGVLSSTSQKKPCLQQGLRRVSVACSVSSASSSASVSSSSKAHPQGQQQLQSQQGSRAQPAPATTSGSRHIDPHRAATKLVVAMERTKKSQQMLHNWDKKMGLKKSHSKTMRMSRTSREKLLDEVGMQLLMAGGGIAAEMAFHHQAGTAGLVR